jgi:alkaline phosphatase D
MPQSRMERLLPLNPHLRYGHGDQHGYMRFSVDAKQMRARIRTLDNVADPNSGIKTTASFVVEAARPSAQPV